MSRFENLTVFQPVINGVGGNLVAVQASRISTALHKQAELGTLLIPPGHAHPVIFITPIANFFGKGKEIVTSSRPAAFRTNSSYFSVPLRFARQDNQGPNGYGDTRSHNFHLPD